MRLTATAGLFAFSIFMIASNSQVQANALDVSNIETESYLVALETQAADQQGEVKETKPEPVNYEIVENDSLSKIAKKYATSWKRIYDKNTQIEHPDVINAGDSITIPTADESLTERPLPEVHSQPVIESEPSTTTQISSPNSTVTYSSGTSTGNSYTAGYCTWYAKIKRPDMPNNLGNADTWVSRAAAQGIATGSVPRVGAIGQQGMHVVYVESVNGDGTVTVSEMNYNGWNVVSSRTVPASTFFYIY